MQCKLSISLLFLLAGALVPAFAQQKAATSESRPVDLSALPDAPGQSSDSQQSQTPAARQQSQPQEAPAGQQTKRILGIVPNFRSVSADQKLPPLSPRDKFKLAFEDSFDYSDVLYVGILAGVSQAENSYPEFHHGAPAYARYYWHGFVDTVDGNLMTEFIVPTSTHEDPRYYTMGHGGFVKRTGYAISRLLITRTDSGGTTPNFAEVVGNGAASGIADLYYPGQERTWTKTGQRWVTQVGLDGASNLLKEFWPDINSKLFHARTGDD